MKTVDFEALNEIDKSLINSATEARKNAYCTYSNYAVGAALLDKNGNIHKGCNIESADFTLTTHAEMLAIDNMVLSGCKEINTIAIVLKGTSIPSMPCGLCRQKISEFTVDNSRIISVNLDDNEDIFKIYITDFKELLPFSFGKENL